VWSEYDRVWVTFDKEDARSLLERERKYWCFHPTNRNLINLARNFCLAWRVLCDERPSLVLSTGAAVAIPFFVLGRLFGVKLVYLEVYDRIDDGTVTGRLCQYFAHVFAVQWTEQLYFYKNAVLVGPVL